MKHKILWQNNAWEDYQYWLKHDKQILKKINDLIIEIDRTPYTGSGKPEPLKHAFSGWWSRRINHEHRLVYFVDDNTLVIEACRYHYK